LPLPEVDPSARAAIAARGQKILDAREQHPERSLAEHYNPLAMAPLLVQAHNELDALVDRAFGARKRVATNDERVRILFDRYAEMTNA